MSNHDYTPQDALDTLLRVVTQRSKELADRINLAIDAGIEDLEEEMGKGKGKRRKVRKYKVNRAYTPAEALEVALGVLQAHFVEVPLFINSALANFEQAAIGVLEKPYFGYGERDVRKEDVGSPKEVHIELQTETRISQVAQEVFPLKATSLQEIENQKENIVHLKKLISFT